MIFITSSSSKYVVPKLLANFIVVKSRTIRPLESPVHPGARLATLVS